MLDYASSDQAVSKGCLAAFYLGLCHRTCTFLGAWRLSGMCQHWLPVTRQLHWQVGITFACI